ncbi:MAG: phosphoribosylaminoimidazolecarboxamide formyltransferase [Anaerolineae bacterium]|nr:phosphoribosylaminoimidazolecarboxamide formyltransferase [Anaerolineae bacterium]
MQVDFKYGCNPHQTPAWMLIEQEPAPLQVLNGKPGYINMLDALGAWQLVRECRAATGQASAASFKHTSPAGAAIARPLTEAFCRSQMLSQVDLSPVATAYARARGGDRMSSFGDAVAVSDPVDVSLANLLAAEVSDLLIAPAYEPEALEILKAKKGGGFLVLQIDPDYEPKTIMDNRDVFGFTLQQKRNTAQLTPEHFQNVVSAKKEIPADVLETLLVGTIALKYTQSNSVCVAYDGQVIGMGAGQQSRIHCTRLACDKAEKWFLQQHPRVLDLPFREGLKKPEKANVVDQYLLWEQLSQPEEKAMLAGLTQTPATIRREERLAWLKDFDGICLCSDAFIPFRDNIDRASRSNVQYVAQAGNSLRDAEVTAAAEQYGMVMVHTGMRYFLH